MKDEPHTPSPIWIASLLVPGLALVAGVSLMAQLTAAEPAPRAPLATAVATLDPIISTPTADAPPDAHPSPATSAEAPQPSRTVSTSARAGGRIAPALGERFLYGQSLEGRMLHGIRFGDSQAPTALALIAAIHGDEHNGATFVRDLTRMLEGRVVSVPDGTALYLIPEASPDGSAHETRENARGVDLNRNWDTFDWRADAWSAAGLAVGGGGAEPFSEPESRALRDWLLALRAQHPSPPHLIFLHAAFPETGLITPGHHLVSGQVLADAPARQFGQRLAALGGFRYTNHWPGQYPVTGDASTWAVANGMPAVTLELPTHSVLSAAETRALARTVLSLLQDQVAVTASE